MDSPTNDHQPTNLPSNTLATASSDEEEYETAYDKLQKSRFVKRRGRSYGVSSLESLPPSSGAADNNFLTEGELNLSQFGLGERKSVMQLDDDASKSDSDKDEDEEEVGDKDAESEDEMEAGYTEASGVGFSQGRGFNDEASVNDEGSADSAEESKENEFDDEASAAEEEEVKEFDDEASTAEEMERVSSDRDEEAIAKEDEPADSQEDQPQDPLEAADTTPTEAQLYTLVDSIYSTADKNTMTVKQVNKSVAAHFGMVKVSKEMKGLIKERLTGLVSGEILGGENLGEEVKKGEKSKGERKSKNEKKGKSKGEKQKRKSKPSKKKIAAESDADADAEMSQDETAEYDTSSDYDEPKSKSTRRKSRTSMAQRLKHHHTKQRLRQLSQIRKEESATIKDRDDHEGEEAPKLSEADRARAQAIAQRFDTSREEEVIKREEDWEGLIGVLRRRRLEILDEQNDEGEVQSEKKDEPREEGEKVEMIDLDDESSEEELDIVPAVKKPSALECLSSKPVAPVVVRKKPANSRLALRNALRAKQVKAGNRWLARELGYKTEQDHIRECMEVEAKKRKQILFLEKQAAKKGVGMSNPAFDVPADGDAVASGDEEDEEAAMARQLEHSELKSEVVEEMVDQGGDGGIENDGEEMLNEGGGEGFGDDTDVPLDDNSGSVSQITPAADEDKSREFVEPEPTIEKSSPATSPAKVVTTIVSPSGSRVVPDAASHETSEVEESLQSEPDQTTTLDEPSEPDQDVPELQSDEIMASVDDNNMDQAEDGTATAATDSQVEETETKSNKPKNSAWQEMLRKEKEMLAKQKKIHRKGGGLVEGEAEEEEEEEGIVGLEDFGFSVEKKKDGDADEDDADADDEDLEHVVDDLSDGEGDEEAGEKARKQQEAREEKERHKEIMRRMREGYDGRRGGIASGAGGARGLHRFDQLVAADNREDAKRLGLLNEDEMESDDEDNENGEAKAKKDSADDDDEAALLDKMLKERFLNREEDEFLEENFSDDEDENADVDDEANGDSPEDNDEKEQDRLAKQFAKRARMNRILEAYEGDTEFSRSRLIDEDTSMQIELKTMKTTQNKKRGSLSSDSSSNLYSSLFKRQKSDSDVTSQQAKVSSKEKSSFTSREGSLSVALLASRSVGRKRKTTFLSGKQSNCFSRKDSSSSKSISLSHVVFVTGESQSASQFSTNASNLGKSSNKKAPKLSASSSLWNRAISKNWSGK